MIGIVFLCKYKSGEAKVVDPNELSAVEWMSYDEIMSNPLIPSWTKQSIEKANQVLKI